MGNVPHAIDIPDIMDAVWTTVEWAEELNAPRGFHPDVVPMTISWINEFLSTPGVLDAITALDLDAGAIGHSLWLTAQGYGTGFWEFSDPHGRALAEAASNSQFAAVYPYVTSDGYLFLA